MPIHFGSNAKTLHLGLGRYLYATPPADKPIDWGDPVYSLNGYHLGFFENYRDTGIRLFDTKKSWRIVITFQADTASYSKENIGTVLHCRLESGGYPGFTLDTNGSNHYRVAMGDSHDLNIPITDITTHTVEIQYLGNSGIVSMQVAGESQVQTWAWTYTQVNNTLLVGGHVTSDGTYGQYWKGTISVQVYVKNDL